MVRRSVAGRISGYCSFWAGLSLLTALFTLYASAQKPELVIDAGPGTVRSIAFSPDGRILASSSAEQGVALWDAESGRLIRKLALDQGSGGGLAYSPNGRTLATGSIHGIQLWDMTAAANSGSLSTSDVIDIAFSPDGQMLASSRADDTITLWDPITHGRIATLTGHSGPVWAVAFSPVGHMLVSSGQDGTVKLWDPITHGLLGTLTGHSGPVWAVAFSPDGLMLASGGDDGIRFWDVVARVPSGAPLHSDPVGSVAFSPNGHTLASSNGNVIRFWDVASRRLLEPSFIRVDENERTLVTFSANGRLAWGGGNQAIAIWTGAEKPRIVSRSISEVCRVAFSPVGLTLGARTADGTIELWDVAGGHHPERVKWFNARASGVFGGLSPDDAFMWYPVTGLSANFVNEGKKIIAVGDLRRAILRVNREDVPCLIAFSPDGRFVAGPSDPDGEGVPAITVWDVRSGQEYRTFKGHKQAIRSMAFEPDGHTLASLDDAQLIEWDVTSGEQRTQRAIADNHAIFKNGRAPWSWVELSPDGHTLAWNSSLDETVAVWDTKTNETWNIGPNQAFAFSPDGRTLAGCGGGSTLWNVADKQQIKRSLRGFCYGRRLTLSPDAHTLASPYRIWDAAGEKESGLDVSDKRVNSVSLSADGRFLARATSNDSIRFLEVASGRELAALNLFNNGDWVVSDPEGRFDSGNLDEIRGLDWVFPDEPLKALSPEIFVRDYYVPHLLTRVLRGEKLPEVRSLSSLNRVQPSLEIVGVEREAGTESVSVTVKVTSTRSQVQKDAKGDYLESGAFDLRLFRDGQLVGQWPEASQPDEAMGVKSSSAVEFQTWRNHREIKLVNGEYIHTFRHIRLPKRAGVDKVQFTAYAFNSDRVKSLTTPSSEYSIPKTSTMPGTVVSRRAYLISMGVNANQSHWNLDFAVASAQDAARLLHDKLARGYEVVDISLFSTLAPDSPQVLLQQAAKVNLKAVLDLLAGRPVEEALRDAIDPDRRIAPATPDDAVVLFISSHGYADPQGTFYVVPYDTGSSLGVTEDLLNRCEAHPGDRTAGCQKADAFLGHTISSQEFTRWWAGVDAEEMVMILDSCHSAAAPGRQFRPGPLGDAGLGQLSYDKGMRILTATQPDKTARATLVEELGHSLLVEALLEEAKAHPQETLAEWLHDTERQVPVLTHRLYPELSEADVQSPELFDFAVTERHQIQSHSADASR